jgi:hypothetical protein
MIQPLGVVDDDKHRLLLSGHSQKGKRCYPYRKPLNANGRSYPQSCRQHLTLAHRETSDSRHNGVKEFMKAGERQLPFVLDASCRDYLHAEPARTVGAIPEESRLPYACLPTDDQPAATTLPRGGEEQPNPRTLPAPPVKHGPPKVRPNDHLGVDPRREASPTDLPWRKGELRSTDGNQ